LGHASIAITLDTYSHVMPGLQQEAAEIFDSALDNSKEDSEENVGNSVGNSGEGRHEPPGIRTQHHLIKSLVDFLVVLRPFPKLEPA
jgi:hypothetical protein